MPNPNAVVSRVVRLEPALDRSPADLLRAADELAVELEGGRRVRLDPDDPRSAGFARILDGLRQQRLPAYLEIDAPTARITRLLIPHVTRVVGLRPLDIGVLGVELELSHGRHVLRSSQPDFAELEQQLRTALSTGAPVLLTEDDAHNIIDIRAFTPGPDAPRPPFPKPELPTRRRGPLGWLRKLLGGVWYWYWWPWWWCRCISRAQAQQVFAAMQATS